MGVVIFLLIVFFSAVGGSIFVLYNVGLLTDLLDGYLAKRLQSFIANGELIDLIADGILLGGVIIALAIIGLIPWQAIPIIYALGGIFAWGTNRLKEGSMRRKIFAVCLFLNSLVTIGWTEIALGMRSPAIVRVIIIAIWMIIAYIHWSRLKEKLQGI